MVCQDAEKSLSLKDILSSMNWNLEDYIVRLGFALVVACSLFCSYKLVDMTRDRVIRVPCLEDERPLACQQRLGDQFEVIYSAQLNKAWGEISL